MKPVVKNILIIAGVAALVVVAIFRVGFLRKAATGQA